jgi:nucleoside-diphosphate-sugar epimerase
MTKVTVVGATGFIGSHLVRRLAALDLEHESPSRGEDLSGGDLGIVFYCAGVTSAFRRRPFDTVDAHVCYLNHLLRDCHSESLVYLSSARLYRGSGPIPREDEPVRVNPAEPDQLYDVSKAMGESLVLSTHPNGRIVRLPHVYGAGDRPGTFLRTVLDEVVTTGEATMRTSLESSRDYVSVDDTVSCLLRIAQDARHRIYNVGSGRQVSNGQIAARLEELCDCRVRAAPGSPRVDFPALNVNRISEEFGFQASDVLDDLPGLLDAARKEAADR